MSAGPTESNPTRDAFSQHFPFDSAPPPPDAARLLAEQVVVRDGLLGALIGALLCAGTWTGLVFLAFQGTDRSLLPAVAMGAAIGVIAGVMCGGWAGILIGKSKSQPAVPFTR